MMRELKKSDQRTFCKLCLISLYFLFSSCDTETHPNHIGFWNGNEEIIETLPDSSTRKKFKEFKLWLDEKKTGTITDVNLSSSEISYGFQRNDSIIMIHVLDTAKVSFLQKYTFSVEENEFRNQIWRSSTTKTDSIGEIKETKIWTLKR